MALGQTRGVHDFLSWSQLAFYSLLKMRSFYFSGMWYAAENFSIIWLSENCVSGMQYVVRQNLKAQAPNCRYVEMKLAFLLHIFSFIFFPPIGSVNLHLLLLQSRLVALKFQRCETCLLPPCLPCPFLPVALHHLLTMHQVVLCSYQKRNFH